MAARRAGRSGRKSGPNKKRFPPPSLKEGPPPSPARLPRRWVQHHAQWPVDTWREPSLASTGKPVPRFRRLHIDFSRRAKFISERLCAGFLTCVFAPVVFPWPGRSLSCGICRRSSSPPDTSRCVFRATFLGCTGFSTLCGALAKRPIPLGEEMWRTDPPTLSASLRRVCVTGRHLKKGGPHLRRWVARSLRVTVASLVAPEAPSGRDRAHV